MTTVPLQTITIREAYPDQFESTLILEDPSKAFEISQAITGCHFVPRCSWSRERPTELHITWVPQKLSAMLFDSEGNSMPPPQKS